MPALSAACNKVVTVSILFVLTANINASCCCKFCNCGFAPLVINTLIAACELTLIANVKAFPAVDSKYPQGVLH